MRISARRLLAAVAFAVLLALTARLLDRLALWQTTAQLRDNAAHALVLAATGDTPYRWSFGNAEDIVAGRAFGAGNFTFHENELIVHSNGAAFEIGLPLTRPIDTRRFPHLHISARVDVPAELRVVIREYLTAPEQVSTAISLLSTANELSLDLAAVTSIQQDREVLAHESVAMLRLSVNLPAGHTLHLRSAALEPIDGAYRIDLARVPETVDSGVMRSAGPAVIYRLPSQPDVQAKAIDVIAKNIDVHSTPLILLPQGDRVEQQLQLRNAIFTALPAAIPIPETALEATFARARAQTEDSPLAPATLWIALTVYALILAAMRYRSPRNVRLRALVEVVLVLAVPLWLIISGRFDGRLDAPQLMMIGLTLAYAISLSVPLHWHWNGSAPTWMLAGGIVALAATVGVIGHHSGDPLRAIGAGHIARYLAWALLQQYLICAVCTERWRIATGNTVIAAYLGALCFALMHTPNSALMLATFCGGLCWCAMYLRERALLPLAVSHAASALLLLALLPPDMLLSAEVGVRFFR